MPRVLWPLRRGRPALAVILTLAQGQQPVTRMLLADTGAGALRVAVELVLKEADCLLCGASPHKAIALGGAYQGSFSTYVFRVQLPAIGFDQDIRVVGVASVPAGFDGIACFPFVNRFTYGNFGDPTRFGLEA
jgi:hypothetical protein